MVSLQNATILANISTAVSWYKTPATVQFDDRLDGSSTNFGRPILVSHLSLTS